MECALEAAIWIAAESKQLAAPITTAYRSEIFWENRDCDINNIRRLRDGTPRGELFAELGWLLGDNVGGYPDEDQGRDCDCGMHGIGHDGKENGDPCVVPDSTTGTGGSVVVMTTRAPVCNKATAAAAIPPHAPSSSVASRVKKRKNKQKK